jgi:nucleotide-binding universal stress UspA family protein
MKRILIPIDGSPRSLLAVEQAKMSFSPKVFEVVLLMVKEDAGYLNTEDEEQMETGDLERKLDLVERGLENYSIIKRTAVGKPGARIVECAKEMAVDMIVMTKSTKTNLSNSLGMTASYVIRHADCNVLIVQEQKKSGPEAYRGLVYTKAEGTVNLRGQLSLKQSECLLPSVAGDAIYTIDVVRGRIRFTHKSYNNDTREWDLPPVNGQQAYYDIVEGESIRIPVNAEGASGMIDRIRVINRNMKTEAVFKYRITADKSKKADEGQAEPSI